MMLPRIPCLALSLAGSAIVALHYCVQLPSTKTLSIQNHHQLSAIISNGTKATNLSSLASQSDSQAALATAAPAAGGVIFFLHLPKTGGTTIRDNFRNRTKFPGIHFEGLYLKHDLIRIRELVQDQLSRAYTASTIGGSKNGNDNILFIEVHNSQDPTFMGTLAPMIHDWRQQFHKARLPFFAFTLVREPVDFAVSYFNFFHVFGGLFGGQRFEPMNGTLGNFHSAMQLYYHDTFNPQCMYLLQGELTTITKLNREKNFVTRKDCDRVTTTLLETMDWIGDTTTMSQDTLPLLMYLTTGLLANHSHSQRLFKVSNQSKHRRSNQHPLFARLKRQDLDAQTLAQITAKWSPWDQHLYRTTVTTKSASRFFASTINKDA